MPGPNGTTAVISGEGFGSSLAAVPGLKDAQGSEEPGRPALQRLPAARHAEVIDDVAATNANGTPTPAAKDPYGYDSEGLVALRDGTFWVSDEYGPYVTHFDKGGYEIGRLTPYTTSVDNAFHTRSDRAFGMLASGRSPVRHSHWRFG